MYIKIAFFIFLACFLGACGEWLSKQGSNNSVVTIESYGAGGVQGKDVRPLVFLQGRENQVCRRGKPNPQIYGFEENCFNLGRETENNTAEDTSTDSQNPEGDGADPESQEQSDESENNTAIPIGDNWFKMGFTIINHSTKKEWLIIESISFSITGQWGAQTLQTEKNVMSGYCDTDPLYIIVPQIRPVGELQRSGYVYEPAKAKYSNNMTIYIEGVPVPDGPPQRGTGGGTEAGSPGPASRQGGGEGEGEGGEQPASDPTDKAFVLNRLPNYRVEAFFRGYWIDSKCESLRNFNQTHSFSLSSSFQN